VKKKIKEESKSTNTYGHQIAPRTADDDRVEEAFNQSDTADPSIPFAAANAKNTLNNQIGDPFGPDYSPETASAMRYAGEQNINQQQGQAMSEDVWRRKQAKFGQAATMRQLRAPQLVQTGGTSVGKQTTNAADFWNGLISGGIKYAFGGA